MEGKLGMGDVSPSHHQHQRGLWKSLQGKSKLTSSPKLGKKERKQESGFWIFKKKKPNGLDRAMSSSQPNLHNAAAPEGSNGGESGRARRGTPEQSAGRAPAAAASLGAEIQTLKRTMSAKPTLSHLVQSQHKPPQQESTSTEGAVVDGNEEQISKSMGINAVGNGSTQPSLPVSAMYQLDIMLKRGNNLAIRDRGGTSDPYVKFKIAGKEVFRSRIIPKNLSPVWDEQVCLIVDNLQEPLYIKVFDYDFGLQDDFMGSAYLQLDSLEHRRPLDVLLDLQDPHCPDQDLGSLELTISLFPRGLVDREALRQVQQQNLRLSDLHKKSQLWRGIVSIHLIEGRDLIPMDQNGLSDPYVKFKLGHQKYRSKTIPKTLNPQWREQFDLHLFDEEGGVLEISVWDRDLGRRDDFIGQCQLDLSQLSREKTHRVELELDEDKGTIVLLVTLTATAAVPISDLSVNILDNPHERRQILKRYSLLRSLFNMKDVGIVQVKILRAEGLMAADVTGKSDPFCVAELCNDRLQTHTVYKTLNPEWNKVFTFNVKDIHSVLEVTVYDEDRDRSADFLGKVAIPLLNIRNSEQKAYVLKNKELTGPTKGVIFLEADVIFNAVKASLQTFVPPEQKYIEEESKVSKQIFVLVVWNFDIYMIPLSLLLLLTWNYFLLASGKEPREGSVQAMEDLLEDEDEDYDKDDKDSEKKGFLDKFYAIQDVIVSVQNALDEVASFGERVKNTFNWSVPFLSWLAITVLCAGATLSYFIPLRYIVLAWGINKFTKKLRNPYLINNNELMDFLSRVPSDVQMVQYKEFKLDSTQNPNKRRRNNPG
ncbi:multiple C2 and transmembrane domain-containing protein 1-like isoform X2 [Myxocyprinus asiaticus]|uniref:multiple C2 and transmembrane domain-containing protein 1-like isoform X2 n=1 Tax=Myxocyprinus asiaticus TaxID=70543 RepID=UPI002223366D|nr:multiple C2 and transmembrane domain-containing protein 1-like isoform X2 [Myxocyprinus asiaticus]